MSTRPKLLFLAGSARRESLNKRLALAACNLANQADATFIDLADFDMPIYNGDWEAEYGIPEKAIALKQHFIDCDGFFIASPEYNSSFSALLKNCLDWISRPHQENEAPLSAFKGKVAALAAASPGGLGGLRGLVPLRMLLGNIGVLVLPQQLAVGQATKALNDNNEVTDEKQQTQLKQLVTALVTESQRATG